MRGTVYPILSALFCIAGLSCDAITQVTGAVYEAPSGVGLSRIEILAPDHPPSRSTDARPIEDAVVTVSRGMTTRRRASKQDGTFAIGLATTPFASTKIEIGKQGFDTARLEIPDKGSARLTLRVFLRQSNASSM